MQLLSAEGTACVAMHASRWLGREGESASPLGAELHERSGLATAPTPLARLALVDQSGSLEGVIELAESLLLLESLRSVADAGDLSCCRHAAGLYPGIRERDVALAP